MVPSFYLPAASHASCGPGLPLSFNGRAQALWFLKGACDLVLTGVFVGMAFCCIYALYLSATSLLPIPIQARTVLDRAARICLPMAALYVGWLLKTRLT